jgi:CheY-like chemotaxis protein
VAIIKLRLPDRKMMLKEKILFLWENDQDIIKMFFMFFQQYGFLTDKVESFDECVEFCKNTSPNVLITCRLRHQPDTVLELIQRLRANPNIPYVPIIVGYANFTRKEAGYKEIFQAGANACFGYPFDIKDVLEQVKVLTQNPSVTNLVDRQSEHLYTKKKYGDSEN